MARSRLKLRTAESFSAAFSSFSCSRRVTGVVFAADLFNVFVFLEVATLSTCALIAMAGGRALVFGFRYLILASIGATFYLLGVGFLYAATGTLNMADMAKLLPGLLASKAVIVGLVFIFIGLAIKMALMPLHGWLPDAYTYAPDAVSPLISSMVTKVALFAWVRIMYWVVGYGHDGKSAGSSGVLDVRGSGGGRRRVSGAHSAGFEANVRLWRRIAHWSDHDWRRSWKPDRVGRIHVLPHQ